jgi:hypothetical protein
MTIILIVWAWLAVLGLTRCSRDCQMEGGVMKDGRRFNRDERASLAHALMHLRANKITDGSQHGGWYCGNREQFVKRHAKATALIGDLLAAAQNGRAS